MTLYITYDNETLQDGLGAQALRITGVYAIAKFFGLKYLHSPIVAAIEDISHSNSGTSTNNALIDFFNSFFNFPQPSPAPQKSETINIRALSLRHLLRLYFRYRFSPRAVVLKVLLPMPVLDRFPFIYALAARKVRQMNLESLKSRRPLALVAHVRRGYDEKYADKNYAKGRHLPFTYFSDALEIVVKKFAIKENSELVIHTDLLSQTTTWKPSQTHILEGYKLNSGELDSESILLPGIDLTQEISTPPGFTIQVRYCDPLTEAFLDMCTADVLIQGRSALSYLAGVVSNKSVVWPECQTHARLPGWYSSSSLGLVLRDKMLG